MHASIALFVMMIGGPMSPESEITTVPLKEDLLGLTYTQEQEWKEQAKRTPLPHLPTVDVQQPGDDSRTRRGMPYPPTGQPKNLTVPLPPTSPDATVPGGSAGAAGGSGNYRPAGIGVGNYGTNTGAGIPVRNNPYLNYLNNSLGQNVAGVNNSLLVPPTTPVSPGVGNAIAINPASQVAARYGLPNPINPLPDQSAGNFNKPFNNYLAPSGYSPWQNLYLPSNNGTISPYTAYVQPAMNQQIINSHISEQINGVRTQAPYGATSGLMEVNTGGNGLVNPQIFQNYYVPRY